MTFSLLRKVQLLGGPNSKAMGAPWGIGQMCGCTQRKCIKNGFLRCAHIYG